MIFAYFFKRKLISFYNQKNTVTILLKFHIYYFLKKRRKKIVVKFSFYLVLLA